CGLGHWAEAEKDSMAAIFADSNDMQAWKNLASAQEALGEIQLARNSFMNVLRIDPAQRELYRGFTSRHSEALNKLDNEENRPRQAMEVTLPDIPDFRLPMIRAPNAGGIVAWLMRLAPWAEAVLAFLLMVVSVVYLVHAAYSRVSAFLAARAERPKT